MWSRLLLHDPGWCGHTAISVTNPATCCGDNDSTQDLLFACMYLKAPFKYIFSSGIACWRYEHRTRDRKVASSNPGRSSGRIFFSRVNFVCWLLFDVRSTPVLLQWHVKDPGRSAKSAGGRLHLNTHKPWAQRSRSGLTMPLSRHSVGTYLEMRSRATCLGTFAHSHWVCWATVDWFWHKEWNYCARANLHLKKKKKPRRGMNGRTFPQNPRKRG